MQNLAASVQVSLITACATPRLTLSKPLYKEIAYAQD
ncbi:hypothetical protein [Campylobacter curvus]|nr:hypothetical protein [Campylobacter curvus]UEB50559.1 transformation system protein [Campylobacter curvus]